MSSAQKSVGMKDCQLAANLGAQTAELMAWLTAPLLALSLVEVTADMMVRMMDC